MFLKGYRCVNDEKMDRAINGSNTSEGKLKDGVGENASEGTKLAAYDRLGGLILNKDGYKVKTGSFWDFAKGERIAKPKVMLEIRSLITGKLVEHPEESQLTPELLAGAEQEKAKKAELAAKAKAKATAKEKAEAEKAKEKANKSNK